MESFELSLDTLRGRRGAKWNRFPSTVVPAWVADMDFTVAAPVQRAIERLVADGDYGYPLRAGADTVPAAFADRMRERYGWAVDPADVQTVTECVQCMFAAVLAFSRPGDGVVIQTPIYPPFLNTVAKTERRLVENPLRDDGSRYVLDVEGLRRVIDDRTRVMMVCNPHNPTGRVFTRDELLALGHAAVEHDLLIVCDEIHADLIFPGSEHIPMATLGPEIAARTITITSATKGFNIAGLRCAVMHFGSPELRERFRQVVPDSVMGQASVAGVDATVAAWREGQPWLDRVMARLEANRDRLARFVATELPGVQFYPPEATYLAWLDCRDLHLAGSPFEFFLEHGVGLNDGATFGAPGVTCVRLNFATCEEVLDEVLGRMAAAVKEHAGAKPVAAAQ
ncbi:MAG TPA: MalY/PatB family protein [Thermomicrobiales bacterium]|nr:MalY/PatB family protein [Thermomicrobiales bacterium]